jgi:hypothetical protein
MTSTLASTTLETISSFLELPYVKEFLIILLALIIIFFIIK